MFIACGSAWRADPLARRLVHWQAQVHPPAVRVGSVLRAGPCGELPPCGAAYHRPGRGEGRALRFVPAEVPRGPHTGSPPTAMCRA